MTEGIAGQPVTLAANFFQFGGSAPIDVTNLLITIYDVMAGSNVLGPTNVGIQHLATGVYAFTWSIPANQHVGTYVAIWTATEASANETFSVLPISTGTGPPDGPCDGWEDVIWTCTLTPATQAVTGTAVAAASEVLWALTGRRLGLCTVTVRPCRQSCFGQGWPFAQWWELGMWPRPFFYQGVWYNLTCGSCTNGCSCSVVSEALLPSPVAQILQVKVDGVALDPSQYRVDNWRKLVRLGGNQWPICNDLTKADTEVGTWSVTLTFGESVGTLGNMALGELATEFAKLLACDASCKLPKPVQSLTRQGVTFNFLDPNELFTHGRTGLYLTDLFISTVNPGGLTSGSKVYHLDDTPYTITGT